MGRRMGRRASQEQTQKVEVIGEMYKSGMSLSKIAEKFGFKSKESVVYYLRKHPEYENIKRSRESYRAHRKEIDIQEAQRLYSEGMSLKQVAREMGVAVLLLTNRLKENGVKIRGKKVKS